LIKCIPVGYIDTNCYILSDNDTKEAVVIDPGYDGEKIYSEIKSMGVAVKYIILTHGHFDHIMAVSYIKEKTNAQVVISEQDAICLGSALEARVHEMLSDEFIECAPNILIKDNEKLQVGNMTLEVISTPGHTKGSICIKCGEELFTGDTLFYENCGRCDLPGGDYSMMLSSLKKLYDLDGDYRVYTGHGCSTSLSHERQHNPYMKEAIK
jgi:hydroxyacylglutathione hydrolase